LLAKDPAGRFADLDSALRALDALQDALQGPPSVGALPSLAPAPPPVPAEEPSAQLLHEASLLDLAGRQSIVRHLSTASGTLEEQETADRVARGLLPFPFGHLDPTFG
jgi:hypothetical protein